MNKVQTIYLKSQEKWPKLGDLTLTIGNFDGLHIGHQMLIKIVLSYPDTLSAALTLNPHPNVLFQGDSYQTLIRLEDKVEMLEKSDLDYILVVDFDRDFASLSVKKFVKNLRTLGVKRLILGNDFKFGKNGLGKISDLKKCFEVIVIDDIVKDDLRVSTTLIKNYLETGKISKANYLLGYNYFIEGKVIDGDKVGRTLNFPTANIDYNNSFLPLKGIYLVAVIVEGKNYFGMCNIGNNPTINYNEKKRLEVHIFDFDEMIYGEIVKVIFIERIRDEQKFTSKEKLIEQLKKDEENCRSIINLLKV